MNLNWKIVALDAAIVFGLTFIGGFVIGVLSAVAGQTPNIGLIALSNLLFAIVGFAYSAYKTVDNRWAHLFAVAVSVWILSLINLIFGFSTLQQWIFSILAILVFTAIGGGVGILLLKMRKTG